MKTAPEAPAMPAPVVPGPGEPGAVPSVPLHGPVDVADDSLEALQSAFRASSVEEVDTNPVKRKREREKDAGKGMADGGVDHGHDPTSESTFEGAPSASGLHASPSPTTTTLPTPDPAVPTSTPIKPRLWLRAQALLACLPTLPMVWTHPALCFQRQLLPVSQWPQVLRRAGMRRNITILYPLREPMRLMSLGMQRMSLAIVCEHPGMQP